MGGGLQRVIVAVVVVTVGEVVGGGVFACEFNSLVFLKPFVIVFIHAKHLVMHEA